MDSISAEIPADPEQHLRREEQHDRVSCAGGHPLLARHLLQVLIPPGYPDLRCHQHHGHTTTFYNTIFTDEYVYKYCHNTSLLVLNLQCSLYS